MLCSGDCNGCLLWSCGGGVVVLRCFGCVSSGQCVEALGAFVVVVVVVAVVVAVVVVVVLVVVFAFLGTVSKVFGSERKLCIIHLLSLRSPCPNMY